MQQHGKREETAGSVCLRTCIAMSGWVGARGKKKSFYGRRYCQLHFIFKYYKVSMLLWLTVK